LAGAAHLLNDNAGVLRAAQPEQKSGVEHKGKSCPELYFQYEYEPRKRGPAIPNVPQSMRLGVSEKLPQG